MRTPFIYLALGLLLASSGSGFTACSKPAGNCPKSDSTKTKTTTTTTGAS